MLFRSPLDEAAWKGFPRVVEVLLAHGAEINRKNGDTGDTPLNEAAIKGHRDVVALLLENPATPAVSAP